MTRFTLAAIFLCIVATPYAAFASCSTPEKPDFDLKFFYDVSAALLMAGVFIYFIAAKSYPEKYKMSRKNTVMLYASIVVALCALNYISRPTCCLAESRRATTYRSNRDCGCVCFDAPPVILGSREREVEEKAEDGDAAAQYEIGLFYFAHSYTAEDDETGLEWLRRAAEGGNKDAQQLIAFGAHGMASVAEKKKWQDVLNTGNSENR